MRWFREAHQIGTIIVAHEETVLEQGDKSMASLTPGGTDEKDGRIISVIDVEDVWQCPPQRKLQMRD